MSKIYSSIFGRAASYYPKEPRLSHINAIFLEKHVDYDIEFCKKYNIKVTPTTLFFKDKKLLLKKEGIMATAKIFKILEEI